MSLIGEYTISYTMNETNATSVTITKVVNVNANVVSPLTTTMDLSSSLRDIYNKFMENRRRAEMYSLARFHREERTLRSYATLESLANDNNEQIEVIMDIGKALKRNNYGSSILKSIFSCLPLRKTRQKSKNSIFLV